MSDAEAQVRDRLREAVQVLHEVMDAAADIHDRLLVARVCAALAAVYACQERWAELGLAGELSISE